MAHTLTCVLAAVGLMVWCADSGSTVSTPAHAVVQRNNSAPAAVVQDTLAPRGTVVWVFRFRALTPARIAVHTPTMASVRCRLTDASGRTLPPADTAGQGCRFTWLPQRTGAHRIEVSNNLDRVVPYEIMIAHPLD